MFNFAKKPTDSKYASSNRRTAAIAIDMWIVLIARIIVIQILGKLWIEGETLKFLTEFKETFGTETVKNVPEHINFIIHHHVFVCVLIFYFIIVLVGALYHAFFNSSAWQGTIGKRLMKITIVQNDDQKISFAKAMAHYFLSVLPFAYILFLVSYQLRNQLTLIQAFTASPTTIFFGFLFLFWVQIQAFTKRKTTAYDLICGTILINKKTEAKYPWSKPEATSQQFVKF